MSQTTPGVEFHIVIATGERTDFRPLLYTGYALAKASQGRVTWVKVTDELGRRGWVSQEFLEEIQ
jgi:hypothetical protein